MKLSEYLNDNNLSKDITHLDLYNYYNGLDLDILSELTELVTLNISNCKILSLKGLDELVNLRYLTIYFCTVDDEYTPPLNNLKDLVLLNLYNTQLSKFPYIYGLKNLEHIVYSKKHYPHLNDSESVDKISLLDKKFHRKERLKKIFSDMK